MPVQAAGTGFEQRGAGGLARGAAQPQFGPAAQAAQRAARNAVVDGVDHAAGGVAAVQQGGRATQHFQPLDHQRVDRHGMVEAEVGRVGRGAAVVQQADAVAVQPADHRSAGLRAEAAGCYAGQAVERVAQRAGAAQGQAVAGQHAAGGGEGAAQRVAGDHHGVGAGGLGGGQARQAGGQGQDDAVQWAAGGGPVRRARVRAMR